ncbi:hypothetical protein FB45DRAFT_905699 [Roridomyces roridus]|uniref:ABM domain-containing protein n=1 Tax=Roridomyces roridus TaxID=1738132 RepID=A0AAD7C5U3_9AGAR|nr:hypothetical protein FB45DRAFT_905699 [Roridomyces roridus]
MVYTVVAHFYANEGADIEQELRTKLPEFARTHQETEKGTLTWIPLQDAKDPRAWTIFERYESETSFGAHDGKAIQAFLIPKIDMTKLDMRFYNEL